MINKNFLYLLLILSSNLLATKRTNTHALSSSMVGLKLYGTHETTKSARLAWRFEQIQLKKRAKQTKPRRVSGSCCRRFWKKFF